MLVPNHKGSNMSSSAVKYKTIKQIVNEGNYPFSLGQMRHFLLNRENNGLKIAIRKIGKCVYIRTDLFDKWLDAHIDEEKVLI